MYLSKDKNFVFIGVPRTGSHSFQQALESSLVSNADVDSSNDIYINTGLVGSTPNQEIGNFPTNPNLLQFFLGVDDYPFPKIGTFTPQLRYGIMMHHLTPSHLVKGGLITEEELDTINIFGIVRDPIQRWLSTVFLTSKVNRDLEEGKEVEYVIDFIRVKLKHTRYQPMVKPFMKDYFYHEGALVGTPHLMDNMLTVFNNLMDTIAGATSITALPNIRPLGSTIADQCKDAVDNWLPRDCLDELNDRLSEDIDFYNKVAKNIS
jgi:hypothetical protein